MKIATQLDHAIIDGASNALDGHIGRPDDSARLRKQIETGPSTDKLKTACDIAVAFIRFAQDLKHDRAIALASGTAEKPLGEVLAGLCRNGHYLVFEVIDGKSIAHRDHINSDWRDTAEADTPEAAIRALRQKVRT